jgi:hypothetical protein
MQSALFVSASLARYKKIRLLSIILRVAERPLSVRWPFSRLEAQWQVSPHFYPEVRRRSRGRKSPLLSVAGRAGADDKMMQEHRCADQAGEAAVGPYGH